MNSVQNKQKLKHRTGLMVFLGLLAGFGATSIILASGGPDVGIVFPTYFPLLSLPFIILFIAFERYYYTKWGGITDKNYKKLCIVILVLLLIFWDIFVHLP